MPEPEPTALPDWAPTPSRIGALLWEHARQSQNTAGERGILVDEPLLGEFTAHTSPTLAIVEQMIEQACDTMSGLLAGHEPCNAALARGVRGATAYLAAALAEQLRSPSAVGAGDSTAYSYLPSPLYALWEQTGPKIADRVREACPLEPGPGA